MTPEIFSALAMFSLVSSITPGPNNLMLLASGVNFGFRSTLPHMAGIAAGFAFLLFCVGMGLGQLFEIYPQAVMALKILGGSYLIYLAWRIATATSVGKGKAGARPMRFYEAVLFQWVNPKAWMMAISSMSAFTNPNQYYWTMWIVILAFATINLPCVSLWCGFGSKMREFLNDPKKLRTFNILMAVLLVCTVWMIIQD